MVIYKNWFGSTNMGRNVIIIDFIVVIIKVLYIIYWTKYPEFSAKFIWFINFIRTKKLILFRQLVNIYIWIRRDQHMKWENIKNHSPFLSFKAKQDTVLSILLYIIAFFLLFKKISACIRINHILSKLLKLLKHIFYKYLTS